MSSGVVALCTRVFHRPPPLDTLCRYCREYDITSTTDVQVIRSDVRLAHVLSLAKVRFQKSQQQRVTPRCAVCYLRKAQEYCPTATLIHTALLCVSQTNIAGRVMVKRKKIVRIWKIKRGEKGFLERNHRPTLLQTQHKARELTCDSEAVYVAQRVEMDLEIMTASVQRDKHNIKARATLESTPVAPR